MAIRLNLDSYGTGQAANPQQAPQQAVNNTAAAPSKIKLNLDRYGAGTSTPTAEYGQWQLPGQPKTAYSGAKKYGYVAVGQKNPNDFTTARTMSIAPTPATPKQDNPFVAVAKSIVNQYIKPSEDTKAVEKLYGVGQKTTDVVSAFGQTGYDVIAKTMIRTFAPVMPASKEIADIIMVNEIAPKVASGELPTEALDQLETLKKTNWQIVGDVAQTVLAIYSPTFLAENAVLLKGSPIGNALLTGAVRGGAIGAGFGAAQALSSGTQDPKEAAQIMMTSIATMGLLGAITSGIIPVTSKVFKEVAKAEKIKTEFTSFEPPAPPDGGSGSVKMEAKPVPAKMITTVDDLKKQVATPENMANDGMVNKYKTANDELVAAIDSAKETVLDFPNPKESAAVNYAKIDVAPLDNGKYLYRYEAQTPGTGGVTADFLVNGEVASREAAIKAAKTDLVNWATNELKSADETGKADLQTIIDQADAVETRLPGKQAENIQATEQISAPKEQLALPENTPALGLPEPKQQTAPDVITGEGFTATEKANKVNLEIGKSLNDYRTSLKEYNAKPSPAKLKKVLAAKSEYVKLMNAREEAAKSQPAAEKQQNPAQKAAVTQKTEPKPVEVAKPTTEATVKATPAEQNQPAGTTLSEKGANTQPVVEKASAGQSETVKPAVKVENGDTPSGIAKSIEAKAVEKGLTDRGFGELAGYDSVTIKEQAAMMSDLMKSDIEKAKRIATGKEDLPAGLKGTTALTAMEDYAMETRDGALAAELARSPLVTETSVAGQTLRLSAERTPDSASAKIQEIAKEREKVAQKALQGKTAGKAQAEIKKSLQEGIRKSKPGKYSWAAFTESIKC